VHRLVAQVAHPAKRGAETECLPSSRILVAACIHDKVLALVIRRHLVTLAAFLV
jgi:hypothetical protein